MVSGEGRRFGDGDTRPVGLLGLACHLAAEGSGVGCLAAVELAGVEAFTGGGFVDFGGEVA